MSRYDKPFVAWCDVKQELHYKESTPKFFEQRQVWWCSLGVNIGHEEDGKGEEMVRPVVILRKFNTHLFLAVPLTTKVKENPYYVPIVFKEREQAVMVSHLHALSARRLQRRMGKLSVGDYLKVKAAVQRLLA